MAELNKSIERNDGDGGDDGDVELGCLGLGKSGKARAGDPTENQLLLRSAVAGRTKHPPPPPPAPQLITTLVFVE